MTKGVTFPTWLTGPNGERRVFNSADEVPDGWVDGLHPSVRAMPEEKSAEAPKKGAKPK